MPEKVAPQTLHFSCGSGMDIRLLSRSGGFRQSMLKAACYTICLAIAVAAVIPLTRAEATMVGGVFTDPGGKPIVDRQLHFENHITRDLYLARTGSDGSFSADLPAGTYDLRDERGGLVQAHIRVNDGIDSNLGPVHEKRSTIFGRLFNREGVAPVNVDTEAPATAHVPEVPITPPPPPANAPPGSGASTPVPGH